MKKYIFLFATLIFSLFFIAPTIQAEKLRVILIGDLYKLNPGKDGRGGYAKIASILNQSRRDYDNVLFLHAGDAFSPSLIASIIKGQQSVRLMNAMGLDYFTPGNHEFDFGVENAKKLFAKSKYKILGGNLREADGTPLQNLIDSDIIQVGDYKVGIYGLITPSSKYLSSTGDLVFGDLKENAAKLSSHLKEQGADIILALSHTNIQEDLELLYSGSLDILLSGDDHNLVAFDNGKAQWLESYEDAEKIAIIDVEFSRNDKNKASWETSMFFVDTKNVEEDPSIKKIVEEYNQILDDKMSAEIGETSVELDSRRATVRTKESNLGNLISDALRNKLDADIAFANGGGIRGNKVYSSGTKLTRKDIFTELPFNNVGVKINLSGKLVKEALENGVSQVEKSAGRFLQISGLSFVWSPSKPVGSRVESINVGNAPLDENAMYTVAMNDYIQSGGDGFSVFGGADVLVDASGGQLIATLVMEYISEKGNVAPKAEGRIKEIK